MTSPLVAAVHESGRFEDEADARETTDAVLEILSARIARGLAEDVAEQLPEEQADHLRTVDEEEADEFDYETFLTRVSELAGFDRDYAQPRVQAVFAALEREVDEFEFESLHGQLSDGYDPLFETEAVGQPSLVETLAEETDLDEGTARSASEAVLETYSERLTRGEAEDLAARLSAEESTWLVDRESEEAVAFDAGAFVGKVADREGVNEKTARTHAKTVATGLEKRAPEETRRARNQLPADYSEYI